MENDLKYIKLKTFLTSIIQPKTFRRHCSAGSSGHCDISESSSNNSDLSERLSERIANSSAVHPMSTSTGSQKSTAHVTPVLASGSTPSTVSTTTKPPTSGSSGEACNEILSNVSSANTSNTTSSVNHRQVSSFEKLLFRKSLR